MTAPKRKSQKVIKEELLVAALNYAMMFGDSPTYIHVCVASGRLEDLTDYFNMRVDKKVASQTE